MEVENRLRASLAKVPSRRPLLLAASRRGGDAVAVATAVDVVEDASIMASYVLPRLKTEMTFDASLVITEPDRFLDGAGGLTNYVAKAYERELRRRIIADESPAYIALRAALPESFGERKIGGIDEMKHPEWQSQTMSVVGDAHSALLALDSQCSRGLTFPDLTIVYPKTYGEVLSRFNRNSSFGPSSEARPCSRS